MFVGSHERQLDDRGRVALPPQFRSTIGEQCFLTFGEDGCVRLRGADAFRDAADDVNRELRDGRISRSRQRAFFASTVQATLDKQGRVLVEQKLREHAGLAPQAPVVLIGVWDVIELWHPDRYADEESVGQRQINDDELVAVAAGAGVGLGAAAGGGAS